jgi:gliding motility-associated-like protein
MNLVPNGSFEEYWECPTGPNQDGVQFEKCKYWQRPNEATSDFLHSCAPESSGASTPSNWHGYQIPQHGEGYVGLHFSAYSGNNPEAEYVQCQLTEPLKPCTEYYVSFWVNLSNYSSMGTSAIGLRFDIVPIEKSQPFVYHGFELPGHIIANNFIIDTTNWVEISGSYIAQGGEEYVTIGRFIDTTIYSNWNYPTTEVDCDSCFILHPSAYYYVDNVSVIELEKIENIELPNIYSPNTDGINDIWYPNGICLMTWTCDIVNRWGNKVFTFNHDETGWNGKNLQGDDCVEGVYFYRVRTENVDKTGFIQLIR